MKESPKITLTLTPEEIDVVMNALCHRAVTDKEIIAKYSTSENASSLVFLTDALKRKRILPNLLSKVCRAESDYREAVTDYESR